MAANSLGTWIGSLFEDVKVASEVLPIFLLPLMIFSGYFVNRDNIWDGVAWIEYISPFKYGFSSHVRNIFEEDNNFSTNIVRQLNLDVSLWLGIIVLLIMFVAFRIIGLFSLLLLKKRL